MKKKTDDVANIYIYVFGKYLFKLFKIYQPRSNVGVDMYYICTRVI